MAIIVHKGRAHTDDFLAACVCSHRLGLPIFRQDATDSMLADPNFWVLDQGRRFEPDLHNFDHHQIEEELCSFTMVLDHFYGKGYREYMPSLRYIEIFDSYGPARAAEFAGVKQESLEVTTSLIQTSMIKSFSTVEGLVCEPFLSMMTMMGKEICGQIETLRNLFEVLTDNYAIFDHQGIKVLDTTRCVLPPGYTYDQLPTKIWCKAKGVEPVVILTKDSRKEGAYRMVSINTGAVCFVPNEKAYFTHNSGFLTAFDRYGDYAEILTNHTKKG